jgi:hypothetical protein
MMCETVAGADAVGHAGVQSTPVLDDSVVLTPVAGVVEVPVDDEVILWHHDRMVPLQLNPVATTIWWHVERSPLVDVTRDVAAFYGLPVEHVAPGVRFVAQSLSRAGLLQALAEQTAEPASPSAALAATDPGVIEQQRCAQISPSAKEWLERRSAHRVSAQIGRVRFGLASNTAELDHWVSSRLAAHLVHASSAAIRYYLIDAGTAGPGCRYWLLSESGLPLEGTDSLDDLVERLLLHIAELAAVQRTSALPLRLGVLEAEDHAVAVQWDLLASRPTVEPALNRLGYRIRSGQWAIIDLTDHSVLPGATLDEADGAPATSGLPLGAIVAWCGPGSLDVPTTHAEWAWTLAMFGCASPDPGHLHRRDLLDTAVALAASVRVEALADAGPTALLDLLADIRRRPLRG